MATLGRARFAAARGGSGAAAARAARGGFRARGGRGPACLQLVFYLRCAPVSSSTQRLAMRGLGFAISVRAVTKLPGSCGRTGKRVCVSKPFCTVLKKYLPTFPLQCLTGLASSQERFLNKTGMKTFAFLV